VKIIIQSAVGAFARSGPDTTYPVVSEVNANAIFDALAFTVNAQGEVWYLIALPNGLSAWVSQFVASRVDNAPLGQIAMAVTVPPSPTLSPTPTLTITPTPTATPALPPGANARIYDASRVNLRSGPSLDYSSLGLLEPGAPLTLIGRNSDGTWAEVNTFDGRSGWVLGELVIVINTSLAALPITWTAPDVPPGIVLDGGRLDRVREIYARGQQMGNRANSFIVIGDSTSAYSRQWLPIFHAIRQNTYNLGNYPALQQTIDFFRPSNVFGIVFQTAKTGYDSISIFDPTWADPDLCFPGETPLGCEHRLHQPAAAIIYIGIVDMVTSDAAAYQRSLEATVNALLDLNVIPVLSTITINESAATKSAMSIRCADERGYSRSCPVPTPHRI
jgi:SH3-like domain-containing protein